MISKPFFLLLALISLPDTPELNQKVIAYVDAVMGRSVGRGECWDLAASALDHAGAYLDKSNKKSIYVFGKEVNANKDEIFPGDILQLENVTLETVQGNTIITEKMEHHTAIVYEVIGIGHYKIAHQNTSFSGRKVGVSELNLEGLVKGKIIFYRPYHR
jgi:hypothetical protein